MNLRQQCEYYYSPDYYEYLIEYRGDFLGEISKISYACGNIINKRFAIVSVKAGLITKLMQDVPSILFVDFRNAFVLESTSSENVSNIYKVKLNPYLRLSGSGVLIGIVDTGIDYLNPEFMREDNTSRIESICDQTIPNIKNDSVFIGTTYSNEEINNAIKAKSEGKNPYDIVPSKDTNGHGTQMAGIIGARGYNKDIRGVAHDANFVVVKLSESAAFKSEIMVSGFNVPLYNTAEIVAGLEYLLRYSLKVKKPIVIFIGLGSNDYSHDGSGLFTRYIDELASYRGVVVVAGTGNEAASETHTTGYVRNIGAITTSELNISKALSSLYFKVWVRTPNKLSMNVISPSGQNTKFITSKLYKRENFTFISENTKLQLDFLVPDNVTGLQVIIVTFTDLKPGIWKLQFRGEYITDGRYDIWLPPISLLPPNTKFLNSDSSITLTLPSAARKIVSVAHYNQDSDSVVSESGVGYPLSDYIKPDIVAPGMNILTTTLDNKTIPVSGSSTATAIVSGVCALLIQWGIVNKNDPTMYSSKVITYLITGAEKRPTDIYPNPRWGYGKLDFMGILNVLSGNRAIELPESINTKKYNEYYVNDLFIRLPIEMEVL